MVEVKRGSSAFKFTSFPIIFIARKDSQLVLILFRKSNATYFRHNKTYKRLLNSLHFVDVECNKTKIILFVVYVVGFYDPLTPALTPSVQEEILSFPTSDFRY